MGDYQETLAKACQHVKADRLTRGERVDGGGFKGCYAYKAVIETASKIARPGMVWSSYRKSP